MSVQKIRTPLDLPDFELGLPAPNDPNFILASMTDYPVEQWGIPQDPGLHLSTQLRFLLLLVMSRLYCFYAVGIMVMITGRRS